MSTHYDQSPAATERGLIAGDPRPLPALSPVPERQRNAAMLLTLFLLPPGPVALSMHFDRSNDLGRRSHGFHRLADDLYAPVANPSIQPALDRVPESLPFDNCLIQSVDHLVREFAFNGKREKFLMGLRCYPANTSPTGWTGLLVLDRGKPLPSLAKGSCTDPAHRRPCRRSAPHADAHPSAHLPPCPESPS